MVAPEDLSAVGSLHSSGWTDDSLAVLFGLLAVQKVQTECDRGSKAKQHANHWSCRIWRSRIKLRRFDGEEQADDEGAKRIVRSVLVVWCHVALLPDENALLASERVVFDRAFLDTVFARRRGACAESGGAEERTLFVGPNVRVKVGPTAWCQARETEDSKGRLAGLVPRCWASP